MIEAKHQTVTDWQVQQRPASMTRRFEFGSYAQTRDFLDRLAVLSERTGYYPDLNFGRTYVSVNISPSASELAPAEYEFAAQASALAQAGQG